MYIDCKKNEKTNRIPFELMQRHPQNGKTRVQAVNAKDLVYLITPDRYANGDSSNNVVKGMRNSISGRGNMYAPVTAAILKGSGRINDALLAEFPTLTLFGEKRRSINLPLQAERIRKMIFLIL